MYTATKFSFYNVDVIKVVQPGYNKRSHKLLRVAMVWARSLNSLIHFKLLPSAHLVMHKEKIDVNSIPRIN